MFVRADRLLTSLPLKGRKHAISYHWEGYQPHLMMYDPDAKELVELDLDNLDLLATGERRCVGRFAEPYEPCPRHAVVDGSFDQCAGCAEPWAPHQECIFEPRCEGELCDAQFCRRRHLVYAAFYGDLVKIGMTGSGRWRERAIEQGADAIAPLVECPNRRRARDMENSVSKGLRLTQRVSGRQVASQLSVNPGQARLEERYRRLVDELKALLARQGLEQEVLQGTLELLDGYPRRSPLRETPEMARTEGRHRGRMLMVKGKFVFFEDARDSRLKMLELPDVVSRLVLAQGKTITTM